MFGSVFKKMGYKNTKWISLNRVKSVSHEKRVKWVEVLEKSFHNLNTQNDKY